MKKILGLVCLMIFTAFLWAQDPLVSGLDAYARSDWSTAVLSFRKAATSNPTVAEPWYWLIMAEISAGDYEVALKDIDTFTSTFSKDNRISDIRYQQGRVLYLLGFFERSIQSLYDFITTHPDHPMISSGYYWIGECLFSVGRFDEARSVFYVLINKYPQAVKREAAYYRIALIDQGDREDELLRLLKSSHEESLNIIENYQRREKTYEQAITAYQKKISDMMKDTRLGELEKQLSEERAKINELTLLNLALTQQNQELLDILQSGSNFNSGDLSDAASRKRILEELRSKAENLQNTIDTSSSGDKK